MGLRTTCLPSLQASDPKTVSELVFGGNFKGWALTLSVKLNFSCLLLNFSKGGSTVTSIPVGVITVAV